MLEPTETRPAARDLPALLGLLQPPAARVLNAALEGRDITVSDAVTLFGATGLEFHALQVNQRPTFLLENAIGDRAVFSGLATAAPLAATIEAMLSDAAAYASHAAHFGPPPAS